MALNLQLDWRLPRSRLSSHGLRPIARRCLIVPKDRMVLGMKIHSYQYSDEIIVRDRSIPLERRHRPMACRSQTVTQLILDEKGAGGELSYLAERPRYGTQREQCTREHRTAKRGSTRISWFENGLVDGGPDLLPPLLTFVLRSAFAPSCAGKERTPIRQAAVECPPRRR